MAEGEPLSRQAVETPDSPQYSVAARISTKLVQITSRYTGRGPTKSRTSLNTNFAMVLLEGTLTKAEANLVAAGEVESVLLQRRTFHKLMREDAVAAVEEVTQRRVRSYMSDIDPEMGFATHVFIFDTRPETGRATIAGTEGDDPEAANA